MAPTQFRMPDKIVLVFIAKIKLIIPAPYVSTGSIRKINIMSKALIGPFHDISVITAITIENKHIELIAVAVVLIFIFLLPNNMLLASSRVHA